MENGRRGISKEIAKSVSDELKPEYLVLDIANHKKVSESVRYLQSKYNTVSILVNNAGMWMDGTLEGSEEDFKNLLDINLIS